MSDDLVSRLRASLPGIAQEECGGDNLAILLASFFEPGIESDELDDSGTWKQGAIDACDRVLDAIHAHYTQALTEARAEIERLRKVACDCATAIGNGAALSPESSLDFIELLPGEIAKHTDKLRRFLKCARDEGTEALDRAAAAESELSTLRARVREVVGPFADNMPRLADVEAARQLMEEVK